MFGYKGMWKRRIEPEFGHRRLKDLKTFAPAIMGRPHDPRRLGPSKVRHAFRLLSLVLAAAVGDEHLPANQCAAVRRNLPRMAAPDGLPQGLEAWMVRRIGSGSAHR